MNLAKFWHKLTAIPPLFCLSLRMERSGMKQSHPLRLLLFETLTRTLRSQ
ncbi:hypothetical protein FDUTEX481_04425 [Tolypothrix sp. PCC 7601]|nr:hypothetical protein FDUTEX481_04425 [Tolypothrix sp. PCC 7601]